MRDIVDGLTTWRVGRRRVRRRDRRADLAVRAPATRGGDGASRHTARCWAASPAAASRAPSTRCAETAIETGTAQTQTYGVSDDDAFDVGLTCGGTIQVLVQPGVAMTGPTRCSPRSATAGRSPPRRCRDAQLVVWPDRVAGSLGAPDLDDAAARQARGMLALGATGTIHLGRRGEQRGDDVAVFVQSYVPPPRMIIFGAIDFAAAMARIGRFLGYHVTVCDARPVFATRAALPRRPTSSSCGGRTSTWSRRPSTSARCCAC